MARSQPKPPRRSTVGAQIDRWLPDLPREGRDLLADQPILVAFVLDLEQQVRTGVISRADVIQLVRRWSEALPLPRGRVVRLRRIARQADLPIEFPSGETQVPPPRGKGRRRRR